MKQKCIWDSLKVIHTKNPNQVYKAPWKFWLKANPSQFREHILNQWLKRKTSREQQELNNSDKVSVTFQQIVICSFIFLQWEVKHCSPKPLNEMICWASSIQLSVPTMKYWLCTFIHFYPIIDSFFFFPFQFQAYNSILDGWLNQDLVKKKKILQHFQVLILCTPHKHAHNLFS